MILRTLFVAFMLFTHCLAVQAQTTFAHKGLAGDGQRYESWIKENWRKPDAGSTSAQMLAAGSVTLAQGKDPRRASREFVAAILLDEKNASAWLGLAQALLAITPDPQRSSERYQLPINASGAAYLAYQRATTNSVRALALSVLAETLSRRSNWRPAIDALKASLELEDNGEVRARYEALRAEHGFRIINYDVESDVRHPRLCITFSELLKKGVDFAKFVAVGGQDPQGVSAEGSQLCVDGFEHGKRYEVAVRAGLPSDSGEALLKASEMAIYVRDRTPMVRFTGRAYVLPSRGQQGIPLVSINADKIAVEILRIGDRALTSAVLNGDLSRQLSDYEIEQLANTTGARVYKGTMDVASRLNEDVTTAAPVGDAVKTMQPGVYALIARPTGRAGNSDPATQWFIVSDLGLTAFTGETSVYGYVRSLSTAIPVANAKVRLIARNNEVLATERTDAQGFVKFSGALAVGKGGQAPAILAGETDGGDYAFLDLTTSAFDLSDRGVTGRTPPGPIDGYLFAERGIYRPGDTVHLTALARDKAGKAVVLPLTLVVRRPDGVEFKRHVLTDGGLGGRSLSQSLSGSAMTGTWRAELFVDPKDQPIASLAFLVEDFVPERLDMSLAAKSASLVPEVPGAITLSGRYLYGPPADDLAIEADIVVRTAAAGLPGYEGFEFGLDDEQVSPVRATLSDLPRTDAKGQAEIPVLLPAIPRTAKPLEARLQVRLREAGGRTIERAITLPVDPKVRRVGIKPDFSGGTIGDGESAGFKVVLIDANGKAMTGRPLSWTLYRLDRTWQWYKRDGSWSYDAVTVKRKAGTGEIRTATATRPDISLKPEYGRYQLEVVSKDTGAATSLVFNAGWYAGDVADTPEVLDVALDKRSYTAGEKAKLRIASKTGGRALITVLDDELKAQAEVDVAAGGGEYEISVGQGWGAGAYVVATLYRPLDELAKRMPSRAVGVEWLAIDQTSRTVKVALSAPAKVPSGSKLTVPIKLNGLSGSEEAFVTVAAVDLGILNVTRYAAPAPEDHFYAQTRLGTEIRDLYGRLIDGMRAERGQLRVGGDGEGDGMSMKGSPPVEKPLSLYSGLVRVGTDGTANVSFDMPDFNGTVRVMAVAWTRDKLGHGTADVIVRDPVAITIAAPRFMLLGDNAKITLSLHNVEGQRGDYRIAFAGSAGGMPSKLLVDSTMAFDPGQLRRVAIDVKPEQVGQHDFAINVKGPQGIDVNRQLTLNVLPPAGDIRRVTVAKLTAKGTLSLTKDLITDLVPSMTRINVSAGPVAAMDVPGLLAQLDRYPYGCAEQTVSRALPLVYANQLSRAVGIKQDAALKTRVQEAIGRVFSMQDSSGAFGAWGPSYTDLWLSSYVMDFLTRAKEAGYTVPTTGFQSGLDRLQNFISYAQDFTSGGEDRAYALYVLARNGRAPIGELRYYVDTRLDRFSSPLAQAQLGAALAMLGEKERSERAFQAAIAKMTGENNTLRDDYGSKLRDGAALVALASETRTVAREVPNLATVVANAFREKAYTSTQEQAWMLLAAKALGDKAADTRFSMNGEQVNGSLARSIDPSSLQSGTIEIRNQGGEAVDTLVSVVGASLSPEPAVSKGFTIEREYFTLDGAKIDLASSMGGTSRVNQTQRLVVVLTVKTKELGGRVLLVDRLPAGLEIENPRLVDSGDVTALSWVKSAVAPEHAEFRDDRFVAAFDLFRASKSGEEMTITAAYMVRAVTPGVFVHPAATIEDMYRPELHARTAAGQITVATQE